MSVGPALMGDGGGGGYVGGYGGYGSSYSGGGGGVGGGLFPAPMPGTCVCAHLLFLRVCGVCVAGVVRGGVREAAALPAGGLLQ